jgi:hypothetical protein
VGCRWRSAVAGFDVTGVDWSNFARLVRSLHGGYCELILLACETGCSLVRAHRAAEAGLGPHKGKPAKNF